MLGHLQACWWQWSNSIYLCDHHLKGYYVGLYELLHSQLQACLALIGIPLHSDRLLHIAHQARHYINTFRLRQNGCHFVENTLWINNLQRNWCIFTQISLKFVPNGPNNNNLALVEIMARRWTTLIARCMGSTWGPSGAGRTKVGAMMAPWILLSGKQQAGIIRTSNGLVYWHIYASLILTRFWLAWC